MTNIRSMLIIDISKRHYYLFRAAALQTDMVSIIPGDEIQDSHIRRSVCYAYAIMLLVFIARHSERVEWLEKFGHRLLACVEKGE
jgi:transposase InsO family protein